MPPQLGLLFSWFCALSDSHREQKVREKWDSPRPQFCLHELLFIHCIGVRTWLLSETSKCSIFPAFGCPQTRPVRFAFLIQILDGGSLLLVIAG